MSATSTRRAGVPGWGQLRVGVLAVLDRDHPAGHAVAEEVHRDVRERRGDHRVERVRLARPQVVGQLRSDALDPRALLQLDRQGLADVGLVAVPERVRLADVAAFGRPSRSRLRRSPRRRTATGWPRGRRRGSRPAGRGRTAPPGSRSGRSSRRPCRARENPASRPKIRNTPIRSWLPSVVRCRLISSFARVIAVENPMQYSVPGDVVVHRLRDRDERDPLVEQDPREAQRVVAADRHEDVEPEAADVVEDDRGQVHDAVGSGHGGRPGPGRATRGRCSAASSSGSSGTCGASCRRSGRSSGCSSGRAG